MANYKGFIKNCTMSNMLIIIVIALFCSFPFSFNTYDLLLDTAVQIKTGIYILYNGNIHGDIFSWHESLRWIPHEKLWYILVGWLYSSFKITGLIVFSSILNFIMYSIIVIVSRVKDNTKLLYIILAIFTVSKTFILPISSIRPHMISIFCFTVMILCIIYSDKISVNIMSFIVSIILTSLFHGGSIVIPFIVYIVYTIVDVLYSKKLKIFTINIISIMLSFGISIIALGGFDNWMYLTKQSCYPSIMKLFSAYNSMIFTIPKMLVLLITLIGVIKMGNDRVKIMKTVYLCMFILACCLYSRMMIHLSVVILICLPKAIEEFILWLFDILNINNSINFKLKKHKLLYNIRDILTWTLLIIVFFYNVLFLDYNNINTINDAASANAYDNGVISFIRENGYVKIYNDFNIGTWLIFNDIKVSIDNRVDPYLMSYGNDEDYFHNEHHIDSLTHLDDFCKRYNPDCIILYYNPDLDIIYENGEEFIHSNRDINFINEIDTYASDRFKKVYENTAESVNATGVLGSKHKRLTWVIYEYTG